MNPPKSPLFRNIVFSLAIAISIFSTWICVWVGFNQDAFFVEDAVIEDFRLCDEEAADVEIPEDGFLRAETIEIYACGTLISSEDVFISLKWLLPGNEEWTQAMPEKMHEPGLFHEVIYPFSADGFPVGTYPISAWQEEVEMAVLEIIIRE